MFIVCFLVILILFIVVFYPNNKENMKNIKNQNERSGNHSLNFLGSKGSNGFPHVKWFAEQYAFITPKSNKGSRHHGADMTRMFARGNTYSNKLRVSPWSKDKTLLKNKDLIVDSRIGDGKISLLKKTGGNDTTKNQYFNKTGIARILNDNS